MNKDYTYARLSYLAYTAHIKAYPGSPDFDALSEKERDAWYAAADAAANKAVETYAASIDSPDSLPDLAPLQVPLHSCGIWLQIALL